MGSGRCLVFLSRELRVPGAAGVSVAHSSGKTIALTSLSVKSSGTQSIISQGIRSLQSNVRAGTLYPGPFPCPFYSGFHKRQTGWLVLFL